MIEDKRVRRGEIYSIRLDTGYGSEQGITRPGLVISGNAGNDTAPTVIVAYMTTKDHNIGIHYGPTKATGRLSYVQCEQIATVDKRRLVYLMGSLSQNEMEEVESRLDEVLDLGYVDDAPLKEKEIEIAALRHRQQELFDKITKLEQQIAAHADELLTRDVEIAVAKRMYEKAVGIIAAMRAEPDLPERPMGPPKKAEEPPKKEPKLVDINTATFTQLRGIGLTNNIVLGVINGRPYKSVEDIKNIPGINAKMYGIIKERICCIPQNVVSALPEPDPGFEVEVEAKVNVNTASAKEIAEKTGMSVTVAYGIVGKRKRDGAYKKLDDLLNPPRFTQYHLDRFGAMLEV